MGKLHRKVWRPRNGGVGPDEPHAANSGLHATIIFGQHLWLDLQLDPEDQLFTFRSRFDRFRRKLGFRGDKANICRDDRVRVRIDDQASLVSEC